MTDNHMVFFAEIAFIYGGNDSLEKDVFGSEISSETNAKSSKTGSGTSIQQGTSEKHIEFDLSTKIARS